MPLITCPDCSSQVSDAAPSCPKCGRPIALQPVQVTAARDQAPIAVYVKQPTSWVTWGCGGLMALGCFGGIIGNCVNQVAHESPVAAATRVDPRVPNSLPPKGDPVIVIDPKPAKKSIKP